MILNKRHPDFKKRPVPNYQQYVAFRMHSKKLRMYFSAGAVRNLGITIDKRVEFDDIGERVLMWFSPSKDSFNFYKEGDSSALSIANPTLSRKITANRGIVSGDRFFICKCNNAEICGSPVFEIYITRPFRRSE